MITKILDQILVPTNMKWSVQHLGTSYKGHEHEEKPSLFCNNLISISKLATTNTSFNYVEYFTTATAYIEDRWRKTRGILVGTSKIVREGSNNEWKNFWTTKLCQTQSLESPGLSRVSPIIQPYKQMDELETCTQCNSGTTFTTRTLQINVVKSSLQKDDSDAWSRYLYDISIP